MSGLWVWKHTYGTPTRTYAVEAILLSTQVPQNFSSPNFVGKKKPKSGTVFEKEKNFRGSQRATPKLIDCRQRFRVGSKRTSSKEEKVLSQLCIEGWRWLCSGQTNLGERHLTGEYDHALSKGKRKEDSRCRGLSQDRDAVQLY